MKAMGHAVVAAAMGAALAAMPTVAAEETFLDRFRGSWSGSGRVQREGTSTPRQVSCSVTGQPGQNQLRFQGSCRAAVIFSRPIGASLTYDPPSGQYRGTYTGSAIGPAQLTGTRRGDTVDLRIDWPRPVNGDTQARMVIRNGGDGTLRITVADNLTPGGPILETSNLVLRRQ